MLWNNNTTCSPFQDQQTQGLHLPQWPPLSISYKTILDNLIENQAAQKQLLQIQTSQTTASPTQTPGGTPYQVVNSKWLHAKITNNGPEPCSYLGTNNSGTTFRRKRRMLKLVNYTATPEQSAKAAIKHSSPPTCPFSSPSAPRQLSKCMHFAETLLLIVVTCKLISTQYILI